jgi:glycosyltransferase involved in cell wall biosynthesis
MTKDITVCIATIPPRAKLLRRALASVTAQTLLPAAIVVEYDHEHTGAAATKNRAAAKATTPWLAFLDDDDQFLPHHLETLRQVQLDSSKNAMQAVNLGMPTDGPADVVYSIPDCPQLPGRRDPHGRYGVPFDPEELRRRSYIQTTSLIRRHAFLGVGGFQLPAGKTLPDGSPCPYDDWGLWLAMLDQECLFLHVPEVTFVWNHWGRGVKDVPGNTSGDPARW